MRRAVFLDRDGVLNRAILRNGAPHPPATPEELEILPGALEACTKLREAGFLLVVVSNQPDVARGTQQPEIATALNDVLLSQLPLDDLRVCWHDDADDCSCRKPEPGLLLQAAGEWDIDLQSSFLVGDRFKDVEAGQRAGCTTVLVGDGYDERPPCQPDLRASTIEEAASLIVHSVPFAPSLAGLRVKVFADGADLDQMLEYYANPLIAGFTTNPTLMRQAGVDDYRAFARRVLDKIPDRPISFEVFADDFGEMERQARDIACWGENVYVKIPITNTRRESSAALVAKLAAAGVRVNVTALMTPGQVRVATRALSDAPSGYVSVFAGRISDTGRDPIPIMRTALEVMRPHPHLELIWASPREILNVFQADAIGCHVITVTHDLLKKLGLVGKNLLDFSLDTVRMFYDDGSRAGYRL